MREIGSEFWDIPITNKENDLFPSYTSWFLSGRCALQAIIKELKGCHTVAFPSWCCDSMIKPFLEAGLEILFYPVFWQNGSLIIDIRLDADICFVMDYFGYSSSHIDLLSYNGIVIRDVTHSLFSTIVPRADYVFGSLRKWCGIWGGGFAWPKDGHKIYVEQFDDYGYYALRERAMKDKSDYISGRNNNKEYLKYYNDAEELLDSMRIAPAIFRDVYNAKILDVNRVRNQRRRNAEILRQAFYEWLVFPEMDESDCPIFVPIRVPNNKRDELKEILIRNGMYCPVHWPVSKYVSLNEKTRYFYDNELSLVCDQRYNEDDMKCMIRTIKIFLG